MEATDSSTSTVSGNFSLLPWKLPLTSMEESPLPSTSMKATIAANLLPTRWGLVEASTKVSFFLLTSLETSMEVHRKREVMWWVRRTGSILKYLERAYPTSLLIARRYVHKWPPSFATISARPRLFTVVWCLSSPFNHSRYSILGSRFICSTMWLFHVIEFWLGCGVNAL